MSKGDCYVVAAEMIIDSVDLRLCHGEPMGQGPIAGIRHGHAWIETADGTTVFDYSNGKNICLPRETYYMIGKIEAHKVVRYTPQEAINHMRNSGHFGPWEE